MRIGFGAPISGAWAQPSVIAEVSSRVDELGYAGLWSFQRLLYPRGTPQGDTYRSVLDPLVSLGFLAACTHRARLGVGVVNAPFLSPALLAKQAAAIDVLSGGRLVLGLGTGWSKEEFVASGVDMARRGARLEEYLACLTALFSGTAEFKGEFYEIPHSQVLPTPVQRPRPTILLGGMVPAALRRAGRSADGWIASSGTDLRALEEPIALVRDGAQQAGKDPDEVEIVVRARVQLRDELPPDRAPMTGSVDQIVSDLDVLRSVGVTEAICDLNWDPAFVRADADVTAAVQVAHRVLEALAPAPPGAT